jgi:hypothetical protein
MVNAEKIYISPGFTQDDFKKALKEERPGKDRPGIIDIFEDRVYGYYINPAKLLDSGGHGFATGIICVTLIEFLARVQSGRQNVRSHETGELFMEWLAASIKDMDYNGKIRSYNYIAANNAHVCFEVPEGVSDFYVNFRNGIVHDGRIKKGCQFSYRSDRLAVGLDGGIMIVNPRILLDKLDCASKGYIEKLRSDYRAYGNAIEGSLYDRFRQTFSTMILSDK